MLKSVTKNPTNFILIAAAFGVGYIVAKKVMVSQATAMPAYPQYQSEAEVQYPRQFQGVDGWEYSNDPSGFMLGDTTQTSGFYDMPAVANLEGNAVTPEVSNAYYADDIIENDYYYPTADDDTYFYTNDGYSSGEIVNDTSILDYY